MFCSVFCPDIYPDLGGVAEQMGDLEHALSAYENALRHNPMSLSGLTQVAGIARIKENYPKVSRNFDLLLNLVVPGIFGSPRTTALFS